MLPENEKVKACYLKNTLPKLEEPKTLRIKFRKVGNLQYISHLDLQRTFHRILVRAGIPMWYTQGFNPHAKVIFATPLSVGAQSECELVDIRIDREISCERVMELLNKEVTDELRILDVYVPKNKFSDIVWADYTIEVCREGLTSETVENIKNTVSKSELVMTKKTKSGEKDVNIIPMIKRFDVKLSQNGNAVLINTLLNVNQESYLNPEILLGALDRECSLLDASPDKITYTIMRNATFFEDGVTLFK